MKKGKGNLKTFPRSMIGNITMQRIITLITATVDGMLGLLTEEINNLKCY